IPQKGAFVARPSAEEAAELYEVRASLEALAAGRFVRYASDSQVGALRNALTEIEEVTHGGGDVRAMRRAKDRFYDVLLKGTGSTTIYSIPGGLQARVSVLRTTWLSQPGRPARGSPRSAQSSRRSRRGTRRRRRRPARATLSKPPRRAFRPSVPGRPRRGRAGCDGRPAGATSRRVRRRLRLLEQRAAEPARARRWFLRGVSPPHRLPAARRTARAEGEGVHLDRRRRSGDSSPRARH